MGHVPAQVITLPTPSPLLAASIGKENLTVHLELLEAVQVFPVRGESSVVGQVCV